MTCRLLIPMFAVSVCQSVCHAAQLGFTVQKRLNRSRSCLGWTLLGAKEHCVRRGSWSPTAREGDSMQPSPNYSGLLFQHLNKHSQNCTVSYTLLILATWHDTFALCNSGLERVNANVVAHCILMASAPTRQIHCRPVGAYLRVRLVLQYTSAFRVRQKQTQTHCGNQLTRTDA